LTNTVQPDAFVSVHINAMETNLATQGIETYFQNDRSKDLAQLIHESLVKELRAPDRSVRKARFYVINHTPLRAVLAEVGFISNKDERDKLTSADYQGRIASALADGVVLYLCERSQGRAFGTISQVPASPTQQSFTQNLHSHNQPEDTHNPAETRTRRGSL
jgi:N-acetylmuramoyl-L-alanine amidase